tara:strand:+ start:685 stop:903 length:219 start_codon:yes stop_codon:yes gene_type:complete
MELKRSDVKIGELLKGIYNVTLAMKQHSVHVGNLYVVTDLNGIGHNGIWVICVKTGKRFHSNTRYFKKTDKN